MMYFVGFTVRTSVPLLEDGRNACLNPTRSCTDEVSYRLLLTILVGIVVGVASVRGEVYT